MDSKNLDATSGHVGDCFQPCQGTGSDRPLVIDADLLGDNLMARFDECSSLGGGRSLRCRLLPGGEGRFSLLCDLPPPVRPLIAESLPLGFLAFQRLDHRGKAGDLALAVFYTWLILIAGAALLITIGGLLFEFYVGQNAQQS